jgi:hypothetical protein
MRGGVTMPTIAIRDHASTRVLVTRRSARDLAEPIREHLGTQAALDLDFRGIEGVTPSFLDELLHVIEEQAAEAGVSLFQVTISNAPTRLSSKFEAVGRGHGLLVEEVATGTWRIAAAS